MKIEVGLGFLGIAPEHFHPLLVHFPITLWMVGALFFLLSFSARFRFMESISCWMGITGSLIGLAAEKTGEKAASIVGTEICAGALLDSHQENMETALIFFSGAFAILALFLLIRTYVIKKPLPVLLNFLPLFGMVLGGIYLVKGGHQGFQLVYQHGVGVHKDSNRCSQSN